MKKILAIALLLSGCAYAQQQKENEAKWAKIRAQMAKIKVVKVQPDGCEFLNATSGEDVAAPIPQYDQAYKLFLWEVATMGGNVAIIDNVQAPQSGIIKYIVAGRAFKCPEK